MIFKYFTFYFLIFFPSITFGLMEAEIFPWVILISFFTFKKIPNILLNITLLFLISLCYTIFNYGLDILYEFIRSASAYINALTCFLLIREFKKKNLINQNLEYKFLVYLWFIMIFISLVQFSGLISDFNIFQYLVPRALSESIGNGRGVTVLASEPARASLHFILLSFLIRGHQFSLYNKDNKNVIFDLIVIFIMVGVIKAATSIPFLMIYILSYRFIFFIKTSPFIIFFIFNSIEFDSRFFNIINEILLNEKLEDVFYLIFNQSGFRLISVFSSYLYGLLHPVGAGLGGWPFSSLDSLNTSGFDITRVEYFTNNSFHSVRPTSFISSLFLDFGVFGFFYLLSLYIYYTRNVKYCNFPILISVVFSLFFIGDVGDPVVWAALAISCKFTFGDHLFNTNTRIISKTSFQDYNKTL